MLRKFSAEDAAVAGPNVQVPQWSMKMPGMGSKALVRVPGRRVVMYVSPDGRIP